MWAFARQNEPPSSTPTQNCHPERSLARTSRQTQSKDCGSIHSPYTRTLSVTTLRTVKPYIGGPGGLRNPGGGPPLPGPPGGPWSFNLCAVPIKHPTVYGYSRVST